MEAQLKQLRSTTWKLKLKQHTCTPGHRHIAPRGGRPSKDIEHARVCLVRMFSGFLTGLVLFL